MVGVMPLKERIMMSVEEIEHTMTVAGEANRGRIWNTIQCLFQHLAFSTWHLAIPVSFWLNAKCQVLTAAEEYAQRLASREMRVRHYEQIHIRLGNVRLVLAIAGAVMFWLAVWRHAFPLWWLAAPLGFFFAVAVYHARVLRDKAHAERAVAVYRHGIARVEDRWAGMGST